MSPATRMATPSAAPPLADSHDLIRVQGARVNNLKDISVELPKRRLTVFTGVSGSGKSSLVFGTIAAESQRMINETYSTFVQAFMPTLSRPEVDVLDGLTTAIIVDQERMGANVRSTVGTATDANAMLRVLFSRLGQPHIGSSNAFSFNVPSARGGGAITIDRGAGKAAKTESRTFTITGGMCPRCEGTGTVSDIDLTQLYDETKSIAEGAITIPGYKVDSWWTVGIFTASGFVDPNKPIREYTKQELDDFLYKEPTKVKVNGVNLTYEGLVPKVQKSFLSKDRDGLQPHIRAFVDRAATFTACPDCGGTRLSEGARSSRIGGINIADACAMQISDLAEWVRGLDEPSVAPLLTTLQGTLDSFVEIGLGYLSLDRPSGTLSGGESQRTKMIRHLGSSLTDITYVFDEPTIGLHPHDIERMNTLLLRLRDKGNTVLVVEHKPEAIEIADHVVDLGPGAGTAGGVAGSRLIRAHEHEAARCPIRDTRTSKSLRAGSPTRSIATISTASWHSWPTAPCTTSSTGSGTRERRRSARRSFRSSAATTAPSASIRRTCSSTLRRARARGRRAERSSAGVVVSRRRSCAASGAASTSSRRFRRWRPSRACSCRREAPPSPSTRSAGSAAASIRSTASCRFTRAATRA